jgi:hypothetical protein
MKLIGKNPLELNATILLVQALEPARIYRQIRLTEFRQKRLLTESVARARKKWILAELCDGPSRLDSFTEFRGDTRLREIGCRVHSHAILWERPAFSGLNPAHGSLLTVNSHSHKSFCSLRTNESDAVRWFQDESFLSGSSSELAASITRFPFYSTGYFP